MAQPATLPAVRERLPQSWRDTAANPRFRHWKAGSHKRDLLIIFVVLVAYLTVTIWFSDVDAAES
jgi:hypothetical protein